MAYYDGVFNERPQLCMQSNPADDLNKEKWAASLANAIYAPNKKRGKRKDGTR